MNIVSSHSRLSLSEICRRYLTIIPLLLISAGGNELLFTFFSNYQSDRHAQGLQGVLRKESNASNPYLIAQALNDLVGIGFIDCTRMTRGISNTETLYLDLSFRPNCGENGSPIWNKEPLRKMTIKTLNGETWQIEYKVPTTVPFLFALYLSRFLVLSLAIAGFGYHLHRIRRVAELRELEVAHLQQLNDIADRVAHDIRSPLAALQLLSASLRGATDDSKLVDSAIERIRHIAEGLLERTKLYRQRYPEVQDAPGVTRSDSRKSVRLLPLIENYVKEKNLEREQLTGVKVVLLPGNVSHQIEVLLDETEFIRHISNLLNNAIEASNHGQTVRITMQQEAEGAIAVTISDDGKGIPEEVNTHVGKKGFTYGKKQGNGLGVYAARSYFTRLGGKLTIKSFEGVGTAVQIAIPGAC